MLDGDGSIGPTAWTSSFGEAGPLYEEMKALEGALAGDPQRWEALADRA